MRFFWGGETPPGLAGGGSGTIAGSTGSTDNRLLRSDGTGGATLQASSVTVADNGSIDLPVNAEIASGLMGLILKGTGYDGPTFFDGDLVRGIEYDWTNVSAERRRVMVDDDGGEVIYSSTKGIELAEIAAPSAPAANKGRLFLRDNGAGKTQLAIQFPTGAIQVIATEP